MTTIKDKEGNSYRTIEIGNQTWMLDNLKVTSLSNGQPMTLLNSDKEWSAANSMAYCYCNGDNDTFSNYGVLYNGYVIQNFKEICIDGWRVPTINDWQVLINHLGNDKAGKLMKAGCFDFWLNNKYQEEEVQTDKFFSYPSGERAGYGSYSNHNNSAVYWSSDHASSAFGVDTGAFKTILLTPPMPWGDKATESESTLKAGASIRLIKI